jgi:putative transposase
MTEDIMSLVDSEPPKRFRFDYKGMHRYLITLTVFGSRKVFIEQERIAHALNILRDAAQKHRFELYAYCFLPDQLVMIVRGKDEHSNMKEFLTGFRAQSASALVPQIGHALWKRKYLERVLRKTEETRRIANEVFQLPVKAGLAQLPSDYPFQGSFVLNPNER